MTTSRQSYIEQYSEYAMEQMRRYGIPASVTLAQGIIESADGRSMLSKTANNHFGVKGEFNGQYVRADDDKPNEKFKKYDNVGQSYEDHSKVLMADRYQKYTKNLSPDDYKGWAKGIKAGGYASSNSYVNTIVGVIEGANLQKYDQMVMQEMKAQGKSFCTAQNPLKVADTKEETGGNGKTVKAAASAAGTAYSFPLKRDEFMLVNSPFGMRNDPINKDQKQFHKGIDLQTKHEPVLATEDNGKVVKVNQNTNTGGGKSVTVEYDRQDGSKYQATYMHLSSIDVKEGDKVAAGQTLGISGNTGTRTTGEHLHFQVKSIASDGTSRDVDPAAYLAEIAQKGNIQLQALSNGKDLIAQYKVEGGQSIGNGNTVDTSMTPDAWMKKLLSSEDSGVGLNNNTDPVVEMAMTMFSSLMALAVQIDNKSEDEKMQAATDAAVNKSIDLSSLLPNLKECNLMLNNGKPLLQVNNGNVSFTHELTNAELTRIQQALGNTNLSDGEKQRTIASVINGIVVSQQMSQNYQQGVEAQQSQQETVQRK